MDALTLSENGRIVIPAAIRSALGLKPRTALYPEIRDGGLFLSTAPQRNAQRRAYFEQALTAPKAHVLSEELIAERRAESRQEGAA